MLSEEEYAPLSEVLSTEIQTVESFDHSRPTFSSVCINNNSKQEINRNSEEFTHLRKMSSEGEFTPRHNISKQETNRNSEEFTHLRKMSPEEEFAHLKLPLEDIVNATDKFADKNLIHQGGFGKIYKANISVSGKPTDVVARRLHNDYGQGDLEFWNEIAILAGLKHDNLVTLIGFCDEDGEKIIINELEVKGSLDKYLTDPTLTWVQRLQICVGVARVLSYIHFDDKREFSVIHSNIKSSKILLDEKWNPKLSGFELSKQNSKTRRNRIVLAERSGTIGYVDPTFEKTGFLTHKSDVYSLGVVLFEVLCGRRAFVPGQGQEHSPQYFTKQGYKDGNANEPLTSFDHGLKPPSFVGHVLQPPSFDGSWPVSTGSGSSFAYRKPVSFQRPIRQKPPSVLFPDRRVKRSFIEQMPPSISSVERQPLSIGGLTDGSIIRSMPSTAKEIERFKLQPLFTMKRVDQYLHSPNEELLAKLAISHYDEVSGNLDDTIINQALRKQMHPESFKIFSETAFRCLKEKRARPNIDQILTNLEKALDLQMIHENHPTKLKEQHPTAGR